MRLSAVRRPMAAVLAVGGIVLGSVAAVSGPASAAEGDLTGTTVFTCASAAAPDKPFTWEGTFTFSATRSSETSSAVSVVASVSDMAGVVPLDLGSQPMTSKLDVTLGGTAVAMTAKGTTTVKKGKPLPMPDVAGTLTTTEDTLAVSVKAFEFTLTSFQSTTTCKPDSGADLGDLTVEIGAAPTPTPTPTTTTSATATPTASATPTDDETSGSEGKPAEGSATYACELNIGSEFSWKPTITVSGYREKASDPVSLVASMTDLPGIAPVAIVGPMDFTLDLVVGGKKTTLTSTGDVNAGPKEEVPVADLSGDVDVDGDTLDVSTTAFTFDFPSGGVGATCKATAGDIGTLTVGSEAIDTGDDTGGTGGDTSGTSSGGSLPQTGGGDATPVILLWAGAFVLLGAAVLLVVPGRAHRARQH